MFVYACVECVCCVCARARVRACVLVWECYIFQQNKHKFVAKNFRINYFQDFYFKW